MGIEKTEDRATGREGQQPHDGTPNDDAMRWRPGSGREGREQSSEQPHDDITRLQARSEERWLLRDDISEEDDNEVANVPDVSELVKRIERNEIVEKKIAGELKALRDNEYTEAMRIIDSGFTVAELIHRLGDTLEDAQTLVRQRAAVDGGQGQLQTRLKRLVDLYNDTRQLTSPDWCPSPVTTARASAAANMYFHHRRAQQLGLDTESYNDMLARLPEGGIGPIVQYNMKMGHFKKEVGRHNHHNIEVNENNPDLHDNLRLPLYDVSKEKIVPKKIPFLPPLEEALIRLTTGKIDVSHVQLNGPIEQLAEVERGTSLGTHNQMIKDYPLARPRISFENIEYIFQESSWVKWAWLNKEGKYGLTFEGIDPGKIRYM